MRSKQEINRDMGRSLGILAEAVTLLRAQLDQVEAALNDGDFASISCSITTASAYNVTTLTARGRRP